MRQRPGASLRLVIVVGTLSCGTDSPTTVTPPAPVPVPVYVPGQSYFGRDDYIEYIAGNAPVIFTAPHGGTMRPSALPVRSCGANVRDTNTEELARAAAAAYHARYGRFPHVIVNRLHRDRLDANRDSLEASCGNRAAGAAWGEFHGFVQLAQGAIAADGGRGFVVDLHGHGHVIQRLELGYLLSGGTIDRTNASLDGDPTVGDASSIRAIARAQGAAPFSALLRGPTSLGTLLDGAGFPAVPSQTDPGPAGADYFTGGYITSRYGCRDGGPTCAVQIEAHFAGVRDSTAARERFADALVRVLGEFLSRHWGLDLAR